jgi:hypothetical protein
MLLLAFNGKPFLAKRRSETMSQKLRVRNTGTSCVRCGNGGCLNLKLLLGLHAVLASQKRPQTHKNEADKHSNHYGAKHHHHNPQQHHASSLPQGIIHASPL